MYEALVEAGASKENATKAPEVVATFVRTHTESVETLLSRSLPR